MNAKDRLQGLQAALRDSGVVDVKFFFSSNGNASLSTVANDVADVVEAMLQKRYKPFAGVGDSVRGSI